MAAGREPDLRRGTGWRPRGSLGITLRGSQLPPCARVQIRARTAPPRDQRQKGTQVDPALSRRTLACLNGRRVVTDH